MYDRELVIDILKKISWSLGQITKRFQTIQSSDDFTKDDNGLEKLDSICMQLINIGEALKQVFDVAQNDIKDLNEYLASIFRKFGFVD